MPAKKNGNGAYRRAKKRANTTQKRETRWWNSMRRFSNRGASAAGRYNDARRANNKARGKYTQQRIRRARSARTARRK